MRIHKVLYINAKVKSIIDRIKKQERRKYLDKKIHFNTGILRNTKNNDFFLLLEKKNENRKIYNFYNLY
jgi:hypothetical protein